ncbi:MAG: ral bacterial porin, family [Paraburkholderia sp.]|uniref:porin n=1 Tax=Paraburkholderia sp. TaxID=1926495 RepID=UPI002AFDFAB6|nr:porin [Paraburkholderia sp.]MEA3087718.1 ral bacterial porin, family [Paraburkholderia sp.]
MKKTALIALLTGIFSTAAHAQSSVTLYGLIDAGLTYTSNQKEAGSTAGHSKFGMTDASINPDRFGLRGSEDLGGGLKAIFTLENGFTLTNGALGQHGLLFGRQAFAGLSSDQFGTVTLGRQYDSMVDYLAPLAGAGASKGGVFFGHPYDNDNLQNTMRINNAVKYASPNYNGWRFGSLYGFSNAASGFSNNRAYSFGTSYDKGPFRFAASYLQLNNGGTASNLAGATDSIVNPAGQVTGSDSTFSAGQQRTFGAGFDYVLGPATVGFVFTETKLEDAAGINNTSSSPISLGNSSLRFDNYEVNAIYNVTPAFKVTGSYTFTDGSSSLSGAASPKWNQVNLLLDYSLSRRTDVYVEGQFQHVSGGGTVFTADINGLSPSATSSQVAVTAGLRTRF